MKGEQLLWPVEKRFGLGLCTADGVTNGALFAHCTAASVCLLAAFMAGGA